jgi:ABC-type sugar transport system permease subunit
VSDLAKNEDKSQKSSLFASQRKFVLFSLTPILCLFILFSLLPIVLSLILAFYNYSPLNPKPPFVGLQNFINLWSDQVFHKSFFNTLKFVAIAVSANLVLAVLIAVSINSIAKKFFKNFFRTLYFLPTIAPLVAVSLIWATMFDPNYGVVNMVLGLFGKHTMIYWLTSDRLALLSVVIVTLWADLGYNIVILMAGLDSIPKMFYEAARIDGANRFHTFWEITLPLLTRTLLFVSVMTVISYFQVFTQVQVMTNGGPDYSSEVLAFTIYKDAFRFMKMGYASAISVILLGVIMVVSVLQLKLGKADWEY